ncbi:hypothetical protein [Cytobacillus firmus]|uniref:Uncharacterized protein n=1 Tax=Cytobacillus firmus DS1 TaxID=1307436 RepID=W7L9X9_CYTFI|nr:hypothetical protein [Cytobacillus firmus]EWG12026.1 hypothetical protein PBF_04503 [Cytobacillus firmus DS1]
MNAVIVKSESLARTVAFSPYWLMKSTDNGAVAESCNEPVLITTDSTFSASTETVFVAFSNPSTPVTATVYSPAKKFPAVFSKVATVLASFQETLTVSVTEPRFTSNFAASVSTSLLKVT